MIGCPKCNTELPDIANFCFNCGTKIIPKEPDKNLEHWGPKKPKRKQIGLSKLKSLFKSELKHDESEQLDLIKPEVLTLPQVAEPVAMQLPMIQECGVCQCEIDPGDVLIRCSCELITHLDCIYDQQACPQCGRELDLELLLPSNIEKKKKEIKEEQEIIEEHEIKEIPGIQEPNEPSEPGEPKPIRKPTIHREEKREIKVLEPPGKSYFAHIPEITDEKRIKNFLSSYYNKNQMGRLTKTKNAVEIDMFISAAAAKKMLDHCYEHSEEREVMGLILGETYQNNDRIFSVAKDVATSDLSATKAHVKFKNFEKLFEHLDDADYDYQIIGWYHSHPSYSSYMSETDVDTQQRMFTHPYQLAIVIDPINFDMKAFALDQKSKNKVNESKYAII
jgi:proteasome lid subunit RPN8/RPN11